MTANEPNNQHIASELSPNHGEEMLLSGAQFISVLLDFNKEESFWF